MQFIMNIKCIPISLLFFFLEIKRNLTNNDGGLNATSS